MEWVENEVGTGIVLARLSSRDIQHGETAMGQIHPARELCSDLGLVPRLLIVTTNNGGGRDYEERPDFDLVGRSLAAGWCEWVMWRDTGRIAREPLPAELFYRRLRDGGADLYLTRLGRRVDWRNDRLMLRTLGIVDAEERESIKERTHDALIFRWLREGRGWPGARLFGLRRNPITKFMEVDPEQWEFVKRIHLGYARLEDGRGGGLGSLAKELLELGCDLRPTQIRRVLRDPVYMTGQWSVTYEGTEYPCRKIELAEPIPLEVHQRNLELLDLRQGKSTATPPGTFCLNGVDVVHKDCEDKRDARGLRALIRGRVQGTRDNRRYRHAPWVPDGCRGFTLEREVLENPVLEALWKLADHPIVLEEWNRAQRRSLSTSPSLVDGDQAAHLKTRLEVLGRQHARLSRLFRDRLAAGEDLDERDFVELLGGVREEIQQLERRLAEAEIVLEGLDRQPGPEDAEGLGSSLRGALPLEVPQDPARRALRAAVGQTVLSEVRLSEVGQGVDVELVSPLGPRR